MGKFKSFTFEKKDREVMIEALKEAKKPGWVNIYHKLVDDKNITMVGLHTSELKVLVDSIIEVGNKRIRKVSPIIGKHLGNKEYIQRMINILTA